MRKRLGQLGSLITRKLSETIVSEIARVERRVEYLEYLSHGARATYIGNNRVLTKAVVGGHNLAYMVEADDLLISPWFIITGTYELALTNYFLANVQPNSHCLDLGSNFGFFTCLFARLSPQGRVFGVEADRHVYELCRDNVMINGLQHVGTALHAGVNEDGTSMKLNRRVGRSGNTSIINYDRSLTDWHGEVPAQPFVVDGLRTDDLLPRFDGRVDFIKIDVEGAEPAALRGARQTIATNPQIKVVMEWSPGQIEAAGSDPGAFLDELIGQGLRFFNIETNNPMSREDVLATPYIAGLLMTLNP